MAGYTYTLFNKMKQDIKHRGQLSVGDNIMVKETELNVLRIEGNNGTVSSDWHSYSIKFIEGTGWLLNPSSI